MRRDSGASALSTVITDRVPVRRPQAGPVLHSLTVTAPTHDVDDRLTLARLPEVEASERRIATGGAVPSARRRAVEGV